MKLHTLHWIDIRGLEPIIDDGDTVIGYKINAEQAQELSDAMLEAGLVRLPWESKWKEDSTDVPIIPLLPPDEFKAVTEFFRQEAALSRSEVDTAPIDPPPTQQEEPAQETAQELQVPLIERGPGHPPVPRLVLDAEPVSRSPQREAIREIVGKVKTTFSAKVFLEAIRMRLAGDPPTMIAGATGIPVNTVGGILTAIKRHVDQLRIHPDPEWQAIYLAELAYAVEEGQKS